MDSHNRYQFYKEALANHNLPAACIDLELLDQNIRDIQQRAQSVPIRIATKSVRSVGVLKYIQKQLKYSSGFMAFSLEEACFLVDKGLDKILIGYPSVQKKAIGKVAERVKSGAEITLMVDLVEHIEVIEEVGARHNCKIPVCIDVDMSTNFPGVYFGVYRSSIRNEKQLQELLGKIKDCSFVEPIGIMGYEAQIAGVADSVSGKAIVNTVVSSLKNRSIPKIANRRRKMVELYETILGEKPRLVNAGGTGSIESSIQEDWVNEITVGSGFYSPSLFDNYKDFRHLPAAFFALEIVRHAQPGVYTAQGGGYIASGASGEDKTPVPYLPSGMKLEKNEGAGEVQTPLHFDGKLKIGDPVFFRHAKAGELCERFNTLLGIRKDKMEQEFKTYRGEGKAFL